MSYRMSQKVVSETETGVCVEYTFIPDTEESVTMSDANSRQEGGSHYRKTPGEQHWDRLVRLYGLPAARCYFIGNITSYVERYQDKNGIEDLKKARHYIDKLIEEEEKYAAIEKHKDEVRTGWSVNITRNNKCHFCDGTGHTPAGLGGEYKSDCVPCNGTGWLRQETATHGAEDPYENVAE